MNTQNFRQKAAIIFIAMLVSTCAIFAQEQKNSNPDSLKKAQELKFGISNSTISIYPAHFIATLNSGDSESQLLLIQNIGDTPLEFNTEARLASDTSVVINWAFTQPLAGTVQPGDTDTLQLNFDATGLSGALYTGELWVNNNDPASLKEIAVLELTVIDAPNIDISADSLLFTDVFVGIQDTLEVIVRNLGFDTLHISNVVSDNPVFFADPLTAAIPPIDSIYLSVIFAPDATAYFSGTLTIQSDDEPENIFAEGYGLMPPVIVLSDTIFSQILNVGDSAMQTLNISNNGNSDLEYEAFIEGAFGNCAVFDGSGDYILIPHSSSLNFTGELCVEAWINPNSVNISQQSISSKGGGWSRSGWLLTLNNNKVRWHLGNGGSETWFDTESNISPNTWTHIAALWKDGTMNVYINGVKDANSGSWTQGLVANSYNHFIGKTDGSSVFYFNGEIDEVRVWNVARTQADIQSTMNTNLTGNEAGLLGYWNFNSVNPWKDLSGNGNNGQPYGDTYVIESDLNLSPSWINIISNASGTITPSNNVDVDLQFNAFDIIGGNYETDLQIINNDPFDPEINIPLFLTVVGTTAYELTPDSLNFGTIYFGETTDLDFTVTNTGTDSLFVTGISTGNTDFTASPDNFKVAVDSSQLVTVTYLPSAAGADLGEIILISNAPTTDTVTLTGNAIDPPVIVVAPTSITDAIYIGDKATHELIIENTGGSVLNYQIAGSNFGDGSDGELIVNSGDTYYTDDVKSKVDGTNAAGQNTISLFDASGFSVGDEVLIISMQDPETDLLLNITGQYETFYITSIVGNTLTLDDNLLYTYGQTGGKKHQVVRIPQFTDVTVDGTVTCDVWDGEIGGIVFFRARGTVTVNSGGNVDVSGKGYKGTYHSPIYRNITGTQGESITGSGIISTNANANGGGGGQGFQDAGGGGGGSYATSGTNGQNWGSHVGGTAGSIINNNDINRLYFGGAGGEGGADEDGGNPGKGGSGGGIITIFSNELIVSGNMHVNGETGGNAYQISGCGMGGGGGGAAGTVKLYSIVIDIYGNIISTGGSSGTPGGCGGYGGIGGNGYIRIDAETFANTGTITPTPYLGTPEDGLPAWITLIPEQGTVPAGESDTVAITLDATILSVGVHTADLEILSNDIINDKVIVPVNLTVNPGVGIVVADTFCIDNVNVDSTEIAALVINNVGTQTLSITNIILTDANGVFGISGTSITIPAEDQDTLWVTFVPTAAQWFEAFLQIFSNDPTDPVLDVVLLGNGISAPVIDVSPVSFNVVVPQNDSLTETLTINNIGGSDLIYQLESMDSLGNGAGMAASFDGSGDYIQIPDNSLWDFGTGDLTIELWANWSAISSNSTYIEIGHWTSSIIIRQDNSSSFYVYLWGSYYGYSFSPTSGEWFHLTVRRNSGQLEVYINGTQLGSSVASTHNIQISNVVRIGSSVHAGGQYFNGNMDEVRIWNIARTDEEIQSSMYVNLLGNETGLIGYWNFNEDNPWEDLSGNGNDGTAYGNAAAVESTAPITASGLMTFNIGSGTIPRNFNEDIEVTFHADNLDFGVYNANIQVTSNDTIQDTLLIPVIVTVPAPEIDVSPVSFNVVVPQNDSLTETLTINNVGGSDLVYQLESLDSLGNGAGMAVQFDGVNGKMQTTNNIPITGNNSRTVSLWFKGLDDNTGGIFELGTSAQIHGIFSIYISGNNIRYWGHYADYSTDDYIVQNQWYHIATTFDGSIVTIYLNGTVIDSRSHPVNTVSDVAVFGWIGYGGGYFKSQMDEVAIWNRSLSAEEIQSTMYTNLTGSESGLVGYWNFNDDDPWEDLSSNGNNCIASGNTITVISSAPIIASDLMTFDIESGTIPGNNNEDIEVTFHSDDLDFGIYNAHIRITSNDTIQDTLLIPVTVTVPASNIYVSPVSFNVVVPQNDSITETLTINNIGGSDLVYQLESLDSLGNGAGMAASFDGSGDYISIPDDTNWEFGYDDFTISFWMTLANINRVHDGLFARNDFQWIAMEYNHDGDHRLNLWIDNNGGGGWEFNNLKSSKSDWVANTWYHIAVVREGNIIKILVNGLEEASSGYTLQAYNPTGVPVYFGRSQLSNRNHEGNMDEIRIWDYGRSEAQIQSDMNSVLSGNETGLIGYWNFNGANPWEDLTAHGNNATAYGNTITVISTAPITAPGLMTFDIESGTIPGNDNQDIEVTFHSYDLDFGVYNANIRITSNDMIQDTLLVPVTLTVTDDQTYITLDLKAYLEGPYFGTAMVPDLNPVALPLSQPYGGSPWNYSGTENVGIIPNLNVVDWVLAELRETAGDASTATVATQVAQQALFILDDGSVVGLDGVSNPQFNIFLSHNLYVVLWHRNHLGIMSANALTDAGGVYTYDFTTGSEQAYGTGAQKNLGGGVYGLFGSDGNADGNINSDDKNNVWVPQVGTQGYKSGDFNLDVQVDNKDKNDVWLPNIGEGSQIPE